MLRVVKIILIFIFITISVQSQQQRVGQWKSFTDMKSVRGATLVGSTIWAATGGGVFSYDTASGLFTKFTNVEGLSTIDVRSIVYDNARRIWIGEAGGWVDIYNLDTQQWQTIEDIANKDEYINKSILSFKFKGDTVFIVSEFGVSIFKLSRWEFGDTYSNLGFLSSSRVTCMAFQQNRIWIGSDSGLTTISLSSPNSWVSYTSSRGLPSNSITALTVYNDTLVIGTNNGFAYFAVNDTIPKEVASWSGRIIRDIQVDRSKLLVLYVDGSGFVVNSLGSILDAKPVITTNYDFQGVGLAPASSLWIATSSRGLAHISTSGWEFLYPNGPNSNLFNSLAIDEKGILWCAPGEASNSGFYRYNPTLPDTNQWKIFSGEFDIRLREDGFSDNFHKVSFGANGSVWACSWGDGLIEVVADSIRLKLNGSTSPSLPSALSKLTDYVVGGGTAVDSDGKVWIVNRNESTGRSLLRLDSDTTAKFFDNQINSSYGIFHGVVIDKNDTKWMVGTVPWHMSDPGYGLFFFNEKMIIEGTQLADSGWGTISDMLNNTVLSLAVDREGEVWVGTGLGVVIIPDPLNPTTRFTSYPLSEQTIQTIAVDAVNNKWVGTKEGIFVVNADGTQLLNAYNVMTTNKHLLNNDVRSIVIDQKRGIAYFGTEQGLSSLAIEPVQTNHSYSDLRIGPNPFILPSDKPLMIYNLVANSTIKVFTMSGVIVSQFEAQGGGRAFWDGRDKKGAYVSSGIYFIAAFADNGAQSVLGKVAVIRK